MTFHCPCILHVSPTLTSLDSVFLFVFIRLFQSEWASAVVRVSLWISFQVPFSTNSSHLLFIKNYLRFYSVHPYERYSVPQIYDIFNCNWVATRWQLFSTHVHTNNTGNITKQTIHRTTQKYIQQRYRLLPYRYLFSKVTHHKLFTSFHLIQPPKLVCHR